MPYVMKNQGMAGELVVGDPEYFVGLYLENYDPEGALGRGTATWTANPKKALVFETLEELMEVWRAVPSNRPVRPDGKPNRPLTSVNIEVVKIEQGHKELHK